MLLINTINCVVMHNFVALLAVSVGLRKIKSRPQREMWFSLSVSLKRVFLLKLNQKQNINLDLFRSNRANQILVLFLLDTRRLILSSPRRERQKNILKILTILKCFVKGVFNWSSLFKYQHEKQVAANQSYFFSRNLQCKKAPRWLCKLFLFWYLRWGATVTL